MLTGLYPFLAACVVGVVGWAFGIDPKIRQVDAKIDAKIALTDQKYIDLKELINTRFDGLEKANDQRLGRIERALNGHLKE